MKASRAEARAWRGLALFRGRRADRGSATVWALGVVALLGVVFAGVLAMGQAVVARHRAGGGADLAALAAAGEWMRGEQAACARAKEVAGAQGVRLVGCEVRGEVADVLAAAGVGPYEVMVRSRAGPGGEGASGAGSAPTYDGSGPASVGVGGGAGSGPDRFGADRPGRSG